MKKPEVKGMDGKDYANYLKIPQDDYIALVDVANDFLTCEDDSKQKTYDETKNNVMRRFDVDEVTAEKYIMTVCFALMLHTMGEISVSTSPAMITGFTPDIAIINMAKSAGAMSILMNPTALLEEHEDLQLSIERISKSLGVPENFVVSTKRRAPQILTLIALYPAFALGIIDEAFVIEKLQNFVGENKVSPIEVRDNLDVFFTIAAANDKEDNTKEEE